MNYNNLEKGPRFLDTLYFAIITTKSWWPLSVQGTHYVGKINESIIVRWSSLIIIVEICFLKGLEYIC